MFNKSVYIMNETQADGSIVKKQVSGSEFYQAVQESNALPLDQRRYFITDRFMYDGYEDTLVIEVTREKYLEWRDRLPAGCQSILWNGGGSGAVPTRMTRTTRTARIPSAASPRKPVRIPAAISPKRPGTSSCPSRL